MTINGKARFFLGAAIVIFLDQFTKLLIEKYLRGDIWIIPGFFDIIKITNSGAGFGILQGSGLIVSVITIAFVAVVIYSFPRLERSERFPFSLVLGGALGNLIDRLIHGAVTDFLHFRFWPAFNIADTAITIGAILIIINYLRKK